VAVRVQSVSSSGPGEVAAATGIAEWLGSGVARRPSSEPTGSTRPAAAKPQSSSWRASSYTASPPPS
ncbi:hypothetical protein ABZX97_29040, partial [Streptomyces seoulensis]